MYMEMTALSRMISSVKIAYAYKVEVLKERSAQSGSKST